MRLQFLSAVAGLTGVLACGDPASVTQDQLTIQATGREVVLSSAAAQPTFYRVVERETAALINFATCVDQPQCQSVAAGSTVRVPYSEITGHHAGVSQEAVVYWWRAVRTPTGPQVDSLRSTVTDL
jgi:hypothetical protein